MNVDGFMGKKLLSMKMTEGYKSTTNDSEKESYANEDYGSGTTNGSGTTISRYFCIPRSIPLSSSSDLFVLLHQICSSFFIRSVRPSSSHQNTREIIEHVQITPECNKEKFSEAFHQTGGGQLIKNQRGREIANTSARHKIARSISPLRVSDLLFERQNLKESCSSPSPVPASSVSTWYSKWNLKEFLFRSKSEGSAPRNKDPLKKRESDDVKHSSFRSTDSSSLGTSLRRKGSIFAHELHYTVNRATSEEMRKKTFLPYIQGWLGCLGFNPGTYIEDLSLKAQEVHTNREDSNSDTEEIHEEMLETTSPKVEEINPVKEVVFDSVLTQSHALLLDSNTIPPVVENSAELLETQSLNVQ